jgi:DNA primase large subunit
MKPQFRYPFPLSMYSDPPLCEVTVEEFEELAFARLESKHIYYIFDDLLSVVLRAVETAMIRNLNGDDFCSFIFKAAQTHLVMHGNEYGRRQVREVDQERRRDHLSHYILRLAYCGNPDGIRWFVAHETALFKARFEKAAAQERSEFVAWSVGDCPVATAEQKEQWARELSMSSPNSSPNETFYIVPFEMVPDLVGRRGVFLHGGDAFVPKSEAFSIVANRFKEQLEAQMERTAKELPSLRDDRVLPLLDLIKAADAPTSVDTSKGFIEGVLTAADIDKASAHFPLCMQHLHRKLRQENHLKYNGRQQYGLFLKSIGLTLEEALAFWKRSFSAKVNDDQFQKNYAYNVRHNYGQEGKRANYAPFSCSKIITSNAPSTGDHHGCPFRHHGPESLRITLSSYQGPSGAKLTGDQVTEILDLVQGHHYQVACTKLFEMTRRTNTAHGVAAPMETITYPSKFYEASIKEAKKLLN